MSNFNDTQTQIYRPKPGEAFHVHTHRCGHAGTDKDSAYVEKAIELSAPRIVFADHAPFPGDPFLGRMRMDQLPEYIDSMQKLKDGYADRIEILCGLEIEYFPDFEEYYSELHEMSGLDLLVLGQHMFEYEPGRYSFSDEDRSGEYKGMCEAMIAGIKTNMFDVVAHPDRAFRRCKMPGPEEIRMAKQLIGAAAFNGVYLELNYESLRDDMIWYDFWNLLLPLNMMIYGLDAHSVGELEQGMEEYRKGIELAGLEDQDTEEM
jgi:HisJ family histidinol phosphate phosphatase